MKVEATEILEKLLQIIKANLIAEKTS